MISINKRHLFLLFYLVVSFCYSQDLNKLTKKLIKIQDAFNVPGVSIVVVKGQDVVYEYNHGLLNLNEKGVITKNTIFSIASVTKTFTALAIGMLAEEKKVSLNDKIIKHLPWFKLNDDYVTNHITIRDVLSHRSGLSSEGLIYLGSGFTRKETVEKLSDMPVSNRFRDSFTYSNILYNALGLIIEKASNLSWEEFVQKNVLNRIEMNNSITDSKSLSNSKIATPHRFIDYEAGKISPVTEGGFLFPYSNGPAGAIRSTSNDMAKYLKLLLNNGIYNKDTLVGQRVIKELWKPNTRMSSRFYSKMTRNGSYNHYGLGWFLGEYDNKRVMFHPGGGGGMTSLISLIPSENIGVMVTTNLDDWSVFAFANTIYDSLLNINPKVDWISQIRPYETKPKELEDWYNEFKGNQIKNTKPSLDLKKYEGIYSHKTYGNVKVEFKDGKLILKRGEYISDLTHWHYDTFKSIMRNKSFGLDTVTFYIGYDGTVEELMLWDEKGFVKNKENKHH